MLYAQAKWVARVLSGRARLPPAADMLAKCRSFEAAHAAAGLPLRYLHCQVGKKRPTEKFHFQNNPGFENPRSLQGGWLSEAAHIAAGLRCATSVRWGQAHIRDSCSPAGWFGADSKGLRRSPRGCRCATCTARRGHSL